MHLSYNIDNVTSPFILLSSYLSTFRYLLSFNGILISSYNILVMTFFIFFSGPTVVGYGLEGALKFGFYETFKGLFKTLTTSKVFNLLMASVVAGCIASIVLVSFKYFEINRELEVKEITENIEIRG